MPIALLLPPAIAWLAMTLPRARARPALAGGVVAALGLASLAVAGGADWRAAGLPPTYLAVTASLIAIGVIVAVAQGVQALRQAVVTGPALLPGTALVVVLGLGVWLATPVALASGVHRAGLSLLLLGLGFAALIAAGRALNLPEWVQRFDQSVFGVAAAKSDRLVSRGLLVAHLMLALIAFVAPHLMLLLLASAGTVITGVLLAREADGARRLAWAPIAGLVVLTVISGFTISIAGETPLNLVDLREGPFSPAFELIATLGFVLAVWPLLGLFPFHRRWGGPATALAGAAILIRVVDPVLSGGTEHWQPLVFPLLVLSVWYAAGSGSVRLAIVSVACAGLITLRPEAQWAGVVLLAGEALVSTVRLFNPGRRVESGVVGLVVVVMMAGTIPLLTGALQAQIFYTVLLAAGLAASFLVRESAPAR